MRWNAISFKQWNIIRTVQYHQNSAISLDNWVICSESSGRFAAKNLLQQMKWVSLKNEIKFRWKSLDRVKMWNSVVGRSWNQCLIKAKETWRRWDVPWLLPTTPPPPQRRLNYWRLKYRFYQSFHSQSINKIITSCPKSYTHVKLWLIVKPEGLIA